MLQYLRSMRIVVLVEIEYAEIVVGRRQVRRQFQHGAVFFDSCGVVSALLSCLRLCVKLLNLGCDFIIGRGLREC